MKVFTIATVIAVAVSSVCFAADGVGTPITGKIRTTGQKWAHVNDSSESIVVELYDTEDNDCIDGELTETNYYLNATFNGGPAGNCAPTTHASQTEWFATATGNSEVTAVLHDETANQATDDEDPTITLGADPVNGGECNGFTVYVTLSVGGHLTVANTDVTEDDDEEIKSDASSWTSWIQTGAGQTFVKRQTSLWCHPQVNMKTTPSDAVPRRNIDVKLKWLPSAKWDWAIYDDADYADWDDVTYGVSVGLSFIASASFNISWGTDEDETGQMRGGWTYQCNNGVGTAVGTGGYTPQIARDTEIAPWDDDPGPWSGTETYSGTDMQKDTGAGWLTREKGDTVEAVYTIWGSTWAKGGDDEYGKARVKYDESYFHVVNVRYAPLSQ